MKPEQQRIKIAEACGWEEIGDWGMGSLHGVPPGKTALSQLPDYLNDLNACHEMEKGLTKKQFLEYVLRVSDPINWVWIDIPNGDNVIHATAAQRCEAFLKTLNLWEE